MIFTIHFVVPLCLEAQIDILNMILDIYFKFKVVISRVEKPHFCRIDE